MNESNAHEYVKEDLLRKQVDPKWWPEYDLTFRNLSHGDRSFIVPKSDMTFGPIDYFKVWHEGFPAMARMGIPQGQEDEMTPLIFAPWPPTETQIYFTTTDAPSILRYGRVLNVGCRRKEDRLTHRSGHFTILELSVAKKLEPSINGKPALVIVKDQFDMRNMLDWCLADSYLLEQNS